MIPVALDLLMRRLQVRDRKGLHGSAMVCAEQWNIARDRKLHPEPFGAKDFLPELPEDRARREAEEDKQRSGPISKEQFAQYKDNFLASFTKAPKSPPPGY